MRRALALAILAVLGGSAGCLREFEDPHFLQVVNVDLAPARVLSRDVLLNVTTSLDNRGGGATDDVRLEARAYGEDTGFLLAENETRVGVIPGDTTRSVSVQLRVPREGSVRVEVVVFEGDQGKQRASVHARNLGALEPEVVDTGLRVADVDFLVQEVTGDGNDTRVRVQTDLYLTNEGRDPSERLRLQVKAREVTTRLVADVAWLETGGVAPSTTAIESVNLTVPDGYNYVFEILTWRGDGHSPYCGEAAAEGCGWIIVARNEGLVRLAPTYEQPKDQEVVTTDPNVNDFLARRPTPGHEDSRAGFGGAPNYNYAPTAAEPTPRVPGFGVLAAVGAAAFVAAALVSRRGRR